MSTFEIIGVIASVITIVSFLYTIVNSKQFVRRRIARKQQKIQKIENQIFRLGRYPKAFLRINDLRRKQRILQDEINKLSQDL